jgi:hypothetical protein
MSLKRPILPMTQIYRLIPPTSIYRSWPMSAHAIGSWVPPARVLIGMIFSSVCKTAMPAPTPQKGSSVGLCSLSVWRNFPIYARHSEESPYCWRMMCLGNLIIYAKQTFVSSYPRRPRFSRPVRLTPRRMNPRSGKPFRWRKAPLLWP